MKLTDDCAAQSAAPVLFSDVILSGESLQRSDITEMRHGGVLSAGGIGSPSGAAPALPLGGHAKRLCDILIATAAILATAPLMLVIAALVSWNGGSPIYPHERVGFGGRRFKCLKFRTMLRDGDRVLKDLLENDPVSRREWLSHRKLKNDPRITTIGRFLRKSSLDELPQLFNVLRGDMSCVGPRPVTADELAYYSEHLDEYMSARPGITGQWQISGRSDVSMERRVQMDVDYLRSWSLAGDLSILLRTPVELIRSKGSY